MKLNKLFASAAAAVLALTAVAPVATVANAATNGVPGGLGETSTQKNDTSGTVSGDSTASVNVRDGFLSLDDVPDLSFNPAVKGSGVASFSDNNNLNAETHRAPNVGNSQGLLRITDSRHNTDASGSETDRSLGFHLTAKLGAFTSDARDNSNDMTSGFSIVFNKNINETKNAAQAIQKDATISQDADNTILTEPANNNRQTFSYYLGGKGFDKDSISLNMPTNLDEGAYTAPITWTLSAAVQ